MQFFFHFTGAVSKSDTKGIDLSGMAAAREKAAALICEYVRDHPKAIWGGKELHLEVSDSNGLVFFAIMMAGFDAPLIQQ